MRYHNVSFMSQSCLHFLFIQSLYSFSNFLNFFKLLVYVKNGKWVVINDHMHNQLGSTLSPPTTIFTTEMAIRNAIIRIHRNINISNKIFFACTFIHVTP